MPMRDCCIVLLAWSTVLASASPLSFNRDIRKAKLRLDREVDSRAELKSGARAIVPGNLGDSELIHRIATTDAEECMARYWLDAARYADTHGFFTDDERSMWRWRD